MTIYSVAPDADETPTLWRAKDEDDQYPEAIASLFDGGEVEPVVFRAAAAVLAPSDALILAMAEAMFAEAGGHSWHAADISVRDLWIGSAYTALRTLRDHAEGSQP